MIRAFLDVLPKIATQPRAIAAYICVLAAWLLLATQHARSETFLKTLDAIPQAQRAEFCRRAKYSYDELAALPAKDRLSLLTRRYFLIAYITTIIGIILLLASAVSSISNFTSSLQSIDSARIVLQQKLDDERSRGQEFARGVERVVGNAEATSRYAPNKEIQTLAADLNGLLARFDAHFGKPQDNRVDLILNLARATAANALGRYDEALGLITEQDAIEAAQKASTAVEGAVDAWRIRAAAFWGKRQWRNVIACNKRIHDLRPDDVFALTQTVDCLLMLGSVNEALTMIDQLVPILTGAVDSQGNRARWHLARILNARGMANYLLGKFSDAIADFTDAAGVYSHSLEDNYKSLFTEGLAISLTGRGIAYGRLGKLSEALADQNQAVAIYTRLGDQKSWATDPNSLATAFNNRSTVYLRMGKLSEALNDINAAIGIRTHLIEEERRTELVGYLGNALVNRASIHTNQGRFLEAITDCDRAVELFNRSVKEEGQDEVAYDLVVALAGRALAYVRLGRLPEANQDTDQALDIFIHLGHQASQADIADSLASAFATCGTAYGDLKNWPSAVTCYTKAITVYSYLVDTHGLNRFPEKLSGCLILRGASLLQLPNPQRDASLADANRVLEINASPFFISTAQHLLAEIKNTVP